MFHTFSEKVGMACTANSTCTMTKETCDVTLGINVCSCAVNYINPGDGTCVDKGKR